MTGTARRRRCVKSRASDFDNDCAAPDDKSMGFGGDRARTLKLTGSCMSAASNSGGLEQQNKLFKVVVGMDRGGKRWRSPA